MKSIVICFFIFLTQAGSSDRLQAEKLAFIDNYRDRGGAFWYQEGQDGVGAIFFDLNDDGHTEAFLQGFWEGGRVGGYWSAFSSSPDKTDSPFLWNSEPDCSFTGRRNDVYQCIFDTSQSKLLAIQQNYERDVPGGLLLPTITLLSTDDTGKIVKTEHSIRSLMTLSGIEKVKKIHPERYTGRPKAVLQNPLVLKQKEEYKELFIPAPQKEQLVQQYRKDEILAQRHKLWMVLADIDCDGEADALLSHDARGWSVYQFENGQWKYREGKITAGERSFYLLGTGEDTRQVFIIDPQRPVSPNEPPLEPKMLFVRLTDGKVFLDEFPIQNIREPVYQEPYENPAFLSTIFWYRFNLIFTPRFPFQSLERLKVEMHSAE